METITNKKEEQIRILMVDDEPEFCSTVAEYFKLKNCLITLTLNADEFRKKLSEAKYDLVFIDKMIAAKDGCELINEIRGNLSLQTIPIIMITGIGDETTRLDALSIGADDLLVKPISMNELYGRSLACLRRSGSYITMDKIISYENVKVNLRTEQAFLDEKPINLTKIEYSLLVELIIKKGEILMRDRLATRFLTLRNSNPRTLDVHVTKLRKKLGNLSDKIKTVRGKGYTLSKVQTMNFI